MSSESLSPFLDAAETEAPAADSSHKALALLDELITSGKAIKAEIKKLETRHEHLREQATAAMREAGLTDHGAKIETNAGKARLKITQSGWTYSKKTQQLAEELKLTQELERTKGIAKATKETVTVDFS